MLRFRFSRASSAFVGLLIGTGFFFALWFVVPDKALAQPLAALVPPLESSADATELRALRRATEEQVTELHKIATTLANIERLLLLPKGS